MDTAQLVERVSAEGVRGVADRIELSDSGAYAETWWSAVGHDARENAALVADRWQAVLPDSFTFLREVIREHGLVAPITLIKEGDEASYGLVYVIQGPDSTSETDGGIACVGFPDVSRKEIESSRFGSRLPQDIQDFYRQLHGSFQIVIQSHGDRIIPVDEIRTWSERTGVVAPDEFEDGEFESILEGAEYVPDPSKMAVVWEAGLSAVAVDLDRPEECWDYAGGVLNFIPRVGSSGFVNTPSTTIDLAILSFLGYYPGLDRY